MKKIITFLLIILILPSFANALTEEQSALYLETLELAGDNPEKVREYLSALNQINADLSEEKELSDAIISISDDLDINLGDYGNIKFYSQGSSVISGETISKINPVYFFVFLIIVVIVVAFLIYKFKNRSQEDYSEGIKTEEFH